MINPMKDSTEEILNNAGFYIDEEVELDEVNKLTKDMKQKILSIENVSKEEVRTLVNLYYQMQKIRKGLTEQVRSIERQVASTGKQNEANIAILNFCIKNIASTEKSVNTCLELVCQTTEVGRWLLSIKGIGPVLAAGCLSYFDIEGKQYSSQFISYAGLNDNNRPWLGAEKSKAIVNEVVGTSKVVTDEMVREICIKTKWSYDYLLRNAYDQDKGKWNKTKIIKACSMIPYNKSLKTLMFKVGSSFQWQCNDPESKYGQLFTQRRIEETERNEKGEFAEEAARILASKNFDKTTTAYKEYSQGRLPKAHITMRAMRWTEKIFISHLFEEMYRVRYDEIPPRYYALEHEDGHHNEILPEIPYTKVSSEL